MSINFPSGSIGLDSRQQSPLREQQNAQQQNSGVVVASSNAVQAPSATQDSQLQSENQTTNQSGWSADSQSGDGLEKQLEEAVSNMQEFVQAINRDLNFSLDDTTGRLVVKVVDSKSGDLIRQMPSEEALSLVKRLDEVRSFLFEGKA